MDRKELLSFEEIERVARAFVGARRREDPADGRRAAPAPRDRAARRAARGDRGPRSDADDERVASRPQGAGAARRGARLASTVSLDSLDDETFRAMNDVDFPVARVLEGIDGAAAAGLPVKVNAVVKRGVNDVRDRRHGAVLPRHGSRAPLHRVHGRRHHERLAAGRRRSGSRDRGADRRGLPARAGRGLVPRRGGAALPLPRRRRRDRRHRVGDAAVLRRLHARADLGRRKALHLPVRRPGHRPARARPRSGATDDVLRRRGRRGLDETRPIATRRSARNGRRSCRGSR